MIHELEPRHFDNSYRPAEPKEGDMVISMRMGMPDTTTASPILNRDMRIPCKATQITSKSTASSIFTSSGTCYFAKC